MTQNIDDLHSREVKESEILSNVTDQYFTDTENTRTAFTPYVYEIHGNVHYMHCSAEDTDHSRIFYRTPSVGDFEVAALAAPSAKVTKNGITQNWCLVPRCEECYAPMTPHCMFFDEAYSEHYYRKDTVKRFVDESDCLIVVGTALATNLAKQIVCAFLDKELPVIEVNMESAIERGNNLQLIGKSEELLPKLFSEYYKLKGSQPNPVA